MQCIMKKCAFLPFIFTYRNLLIKGAPHKKGAPHSLQEDNIAEN